MRWEKIDRCTYAHMQGTSWVPCTGYRNKDGWVIRKSMGMDYTELVNPRLGKEWALIHNTLFARVLMFRTLAGAKRFMAELYAEGDLSVDALRNKVSTWKEN